jgi:4-amino-4-deoxy-L-arabinose transferase-like glycosyltransferase
MMTEITKDKGQRTKDKGRYIWFLFAILIIAVYFFGLNLPLLGPDEPRYSQIAREMYERGDFITPKLGGFDWFEKPALLYWLQIGAYHLFGVTEFAARFGSALFGLGTILSLWILGKRSAVGDRWSEIRKDSSFIFHSSSFANWLALISASSIGLITFAHGASFDIILTFPITASLVGFFIAETKQEKSGFAFYFSLFTFYFFIGISLIAKGLVGIVFPFAIVTFYYVLSLRLPSKAFIVSLVWGTIVSLLAAAVWYLPMYQANGWKFIDEFFIQHHFQRYTSNKYQHPQPFYFFFWVLPLMTLPWLPFFFASIWDFGKDLLKRLKTKTNHESRITNYELRLFAFAWLLVPLVFFSVSGSKLPGYILPALPGGLILTAEYVYRFIQKSEMRRNTILITAFLTFIGVIVAMQFFVTSYARHETVKGLIETANKNGYETAPIFNLHTVSHNAEFYGAGRLKRTEDGKLRRFEGVGKVVDELKIENKDTLILVPLEYVSQLTESNQLDAKVLGDNGELAIVAVKLK